MSNRGPRRVPTFGHSLLEVIVASGIGLVLLLLVTQLVDRSFQFQSKTAPRLQRNRIIDDAFNRMTNQLRQSRECFQGDLLTSAPSTPIAVGNSVASGLTLEESVEGVRRVRCYRLNSTSGNLVEDVYQRTGFDPSLFSSHVREIGFPATKTLASGVESLKLSSDFLGGYRRIRLDVWASQSERDTTWHLSRNVTVNW